MKAVIEKTAELAPISDARSFRRPIRWLATRMVDLRRAVCDGRRHLVRTAKQRASIRLPCSSRGRSAMRKYSEAAEDRSAALAYRQDVIRRIDAFFQAAWLTPLVDRAPPKLAILRRPTRHCAAICSLRRSDNSHVVDLEQHFRSRGRNVCLAYQLEKRNEGGNCVRTSPAAAYGRFNAARGVGARRRSDLHEMSAGRKLDRFRPVIGEQQVEGPIGNVLNLQPIVPVHINDDWDLITLNVPSCGRCACQTARSDRATPHRPSRLDRTPGPSSGASAPLHEIAIWGHEMVRRPADRARDPRFGAAVLFGVGRLSVFGPKETRTAGLSSPIISADVDRRLRARCPDAARSAPASASIGACGGGRHLCPVLSTTASAMEVNVGFSGFQAPDGPEQLPSAAATSARVL